MKTTHFDLLNYAFIGCDARGLKNHVFVAPEGRMDVGGDPDASCIVRIRESPSGGDGYVLMGGAFRKFAGCAVSNRGIYGLEIGASISEIMPPCGAK